MSTRSELEYFVKTTMQNDFDDYRVQRIYERYGTRFKYMVQTLNIHEETITSGLEIIAEEILFGEVTLSHVLVLLVFCTELDRYCKLRKYPWYSSDLIAKVGLVSLFDLMPILVYYQ